MKNNKIKIDIITLNAIKNYGSVLQTLATQEIFKNKGADVEIINYIREDVLQKNIITTYAGKNILKRLAMYPTVLRWKKVFDKFQKENLMLSTKTYTYDEDFQNFELNADAYCTGSDQVWNSIWNKKIIGPLYLNFVHENKFKFSFASSFGQERLSKEEVDKTQKFMNQYNYISVREQSAKQILENQYKLTNVMHVLDPTLCLDKTFWHKYSSNKKIKNKYILIYNLNKSKEFDEYAKKISKITGLKLYRLCTRYDQIMRAGKPILIPTIYDFINLIENAELVITDSFHATAFSINMHTKPICFYPKQFGGRIENFLQLIDSTQLHIKDYNDIEVINRKIDFSKIDKILDQERKKSQDYIEMVFNNIIKIGEKNEC